MSNNTNIEIDLGYYWACLTSKKLLGNTKEKIRSKVEITHEHGVVTEGTYKVEHEGIKALVGEGARQHNIELDKTRDEAYKILTYTLISKVLKDEDPTTINLVINYPLSVYNQRTKTEFEDYLKTKDNMTVFLDGKRRILHIEKCLCFPQLLPVAYANASKFKGKIKALVDVGGLTAQGVILNNFTIMPDTKFCENLGALVLYNKVRQVLNNMYSVNLQDYEMPNIISKGLSIDKQGSKKIINEVVESHLSEIVKHMKLKNWNIEELEFVFTGGGSLVMKDNIVNRFNYAELSNDPLWDNTIGLQEVSKNVY